jgi:hypothetical protein
MMPFLVLLIVSISWESAAAAVKPGAVCAKKGQVVILSGKKYLCQVSGKKLVWSKGTLVATPTPVLPPSASILTKPPADMTGINDQAGVFSTGLDPAFVTLGPKLGNRPELPAYAGQTGLVAEVADGSPVLAPMNMRMIGFNSRSSDYRIATNGVRQEPFDDLEICFESSIAEWPGLIFCVYHLQNSPLLLGMNRDPSCSNATEWPGPLRAQGRQFYVVDDYLLPETKISASCQGMIGSGVSRGSVIGYAGSVGTHSQLPIRMKVRDKSINPTVEKGDKYLHWVQPDVFFYWKCFGVSATFAPGVLAYPFECDGYQVSTGQRSKEFKYKS